MLLTILCTFRPGALAEAKSKRLEHYEFLRRERGRIVEGGPLLDAEGLPASMLIVVDQDSVAAASEFIAREPYTAAGLFGSIAIHRWRQVLPEPEPGYVEGEYQKEFALRAANEAARLND